MPRPWQREQTCGDVPGFAFQLGELIVHDAKQQRVTARDDTLLAAYLIDPGRAGYELDDLAAEYGVELLPSPEAEEETTALVRRAETPRRLIGPQPSSRIHFKVGRAPAFRRGGR